MGFVSLYPSYELEGFLLFRGNEDRLYREAFRLGHNLTPLPPGQSEPMPVLVEV
jgi:hypothetical protein